MRPPATALWAALLALPTIATAEPLRIASYSPDLSRKGPGLLLRDIETGKDRQIAAVVQVIAAADADVILLTGFDWDYDNRALAGFAGLLADAGAPYPHQFAAQPNSGLATGIDLDGDGRLGTGDDAQGFGMFMGQGGMALLSRHPVELVADHTGFLWRDLPGQIMPPLPDEAVAVQRLSSTAHWHLAVTVRGQPLHLLAYAATPPVFDGPEDRNGRRNHDETMFWLDRLPDAPFVVLGDTNLDPHDSDGRHEAMQALLARVQDPEPASEGGRLAPQDGANATHRGNPALDTAVWPAADGPGSLRVDYVLPAPGLTVLDAGVFWPAPGDAMADVAAAASRHRLVWVDLDWP
ncbi:endonuclease/exonuclease/phosphatase family protein [Paracoccus sp. DMF-8]|uniref:endonuclease/exonuclease/phosphatase family protein n=1 Tax=Paracoccus sp. DMF-8 TaxID=3019445 RepID=UPI0023E410F8|nr:endonuclease/exonuclease/phosphatase family protein [Paracoccus sp. DMF-8]MDF3607980.1 endonuclease/exonuclease/phosphatase family protein [Paracoccus sp. DMF-8]